MTYPTPHQGGSNITVTMKRKRRPGNPYKGKRDELGRYLPTMRSLTLASKLKRQRKAYVTATLTPSEKERLKQLAIKLGIAQSDIVASLLINHLDDLEHQASFEAGQQSALQQSADNPANNPAD